MKGAPCLRCLLLVVVLAAGLRAEVKPAEEPAKTGNWLVDAMAGKTAGAQDESKAKGLPGDARSGTNDPRAAYKPEEAGVNPLSSYLNAWMTPRDLELLKAQGADAPASASRPVAPASRVLPGLNGRTPDPQGNPYVVDPTTTPTIAAKLPPPAPAPKPAATPLAEGKNAAAPAKTPGPPADVLKSQDDAKYFPQLKRF